MLKFKSQAVTPLELAIVTIFSTALLVFLLSHIPKTNNLTNIFVQDFNLELNDVIKEWKADADLVLVGTLIKRLDEIDSDRMSAYTGLVFFDIAVEEVERGEYPYDEIEVYIGMYSNTIKLEDYPPFLKKNYRAGDRLRIYVYYDYIHNAYYTPGALMTVEPAA